MILDKLFKFTNDFKVRKIFMYKNIVWTIILEERQGICNMKKVFLIFLLIFSLLVINNKEYKCEAKNNDFEKIEKYVIDNYDFVENGIKVEYTVIESLKNEYLRIKELFERNNYLINIEENNSINAEKDGINYDVNIYKYGDLTKVQIILINNDVNKTEKDLNELSKEIRSDNFINERYFSFY